MSAIGTHLILEMYDCPAEVIDDLERVREAVREAARAARSTLLHEAAHSFQPQGVTALGLLAESHISVHTWPELGYAAADVFCLPSFAEGVPVVLMEAMAMEIPVVTTRIAGIGELVEDEAAGILVRPGRAEYLTDALARLISSIAIMCAR